MNYLNIKPLIVVSCCVSIYQISDCSDFIVSADDSLPDEMESKHLGSQEITAQNVILEPITMIL